MNTKPNVKIWFSHRTKTIETNTTSARFRDSYTYPSLYIQDNWTSYKQDDSIVMSDEILQELIDSSDYVEVGDLSYIIDDIVKRYTEDGQKEENIYIRIIRTKQDESIVMDSKYAGMICRFTNGEIQKTIESFHELRMSQTEKEIKTQKSYDRLEEEMKEIKKYNKILLTLMWGIPSIFALLIIFKNLLPLK